MSLSFLAGTRTTPLSAARVDFWLGLVDDVVPDPVQLVSPSALSLCLTAQRGTTGETHACEWQDCAGSSLLARGSRETRRLVSPAARAAA